MATLEKIRNRSGLLLGIIGFALFAFIIGDLFNSNRGVFGGRSTKIGEVDGQGIQYQSFLAREQELTDMYKRSGGGITDVMADQIRTQVWEEMIQEKIMNGQYDELGLSVSDDEMYDLIQGNHIDPMVRQLFGNPQTGEVNKAGITQFMKGIVDKTVPEADRQYWLFIERDIKKRRGFTKYMSLLSKSLYVTSAEAKADFDQRSYMVDFKYVAVPFTNVPDEKVVPTEAELSAYYKKHEKDFEQEESRDIEYVAFEVKPSKEDKAAALKYVSDVKGEFETTTDVERFVSRNSESPYQDRFYKKGELPAAVDSIMFSASVGTVYGPYEDDSKYKMAKLVSRKSMPDSVQARHILIRTGQGTTVEQAKAKIDSIKTAIRGGKTFAEMATLYGTDGTKEKGGDLGWFAPGAMVKPFNDAVFSAAKNELLTVETQFGVHLVEVTGIGTASTVANVAIVDRSIQASDVTYQATYTKANKFATENTNAANFDKAIEKEGLSKRQAQRLAPIESRIAGLDNARQLVQWAYNEDTKIGDFSKVFELGNKFVIARLTATREKGIAPLEEVKDQITAEVRKEKKADVLAAEMKGASSLDQLAAKMKVNVSEAKNISFAARQVEGLGVEPSVIGTSVRLPKDQISEPIKGYNGVYVLQVTVITNPKFDKPNTTPNKIQLQMGYQNRANYQAFEALKKLYEVVDNRAQFM